jgi:predicted neutral ceramidase superfamily lipid hydrolase
MSETVENLIGHYHRMFSFPGIRALTVENFSAGIIISGLIALEASNKLLAFITLSTTIILSQLLSTELTFRITPNKILLDRRRSAGLTFASSVLMYPAFLLALIAFNLVGDSNRVPFATLVISASLGIYLRYFTTFMYMEISRLKAFMIAVIQPVILFLGAFILVGTSGNSPFSALASIVLAITIAELSIHLLKTRATTSLKINGLELSRAFFAGWMGGEQEKLEKALESQGKREDLEVDVFAVSKANNNDLKTILLAPKIHAGPFRNLGSSDLPGTIYRKIDAEFHVPTFVFHGAVSHERDLVHARDVDRLGNEILKILRQPPAENFHHGSMIPRLANRMVGGLGFDRQLLVWVSLAPFLSEDLPYRLQVDADTSAAQHNLRRASLLDTHSCLSTQIPTQEILNSLEFQIRQIVGELAKKTPSQLEMGVATLDTQGFSPEEIAGLKGVAAFLKTATDSQGIVLFDSNNMTQKLRQLLDEQLPKALGAPVEIFTTDTHVLVGIRVKKDYSPIGEKTEKQLIVTRTLEALRQAKSDLEPVLVSAVTVRIKDLSVLGEKGIEILGGTADVMVKMARRLLPVTLTSCALLTLLALYVAP